MMTLSVCGCAGQAAKAESQGPFNVSQVYPEVHSRPHRTSKTEQLEKYLATESP